MSRSRAVRGTAAIVALSTLVAARVDAVEPQESFVVELRSALPVSEVQAVTAAGGFKVDELVRVFHTPEGELTVGHIVAGTDDALSEDYQTSVLAALEDLAALEQPTDPADPAVVDPLPLLAVAAREEFDHDSARVSWLIATGPASASPSLGHLGTVVKKRPMPVMPPDIDGPPFPRRDAGPATGLAVRCNNYFVPARTDAYAGPSVRGRRRIWQKFHWDTYNYDVLRACGGNITYEQEFVTNNYDDRYYFGSRVHTWVSNLPDAYLDTRFGDSGDERNYAIGTSDATRIRAWHAYTTLILLNAGNTSVDTAKITGQRGERRPAGCHWKWCIFARATEFISRGRTWPIQVPGWSTWYH